MRKTDFSAPRKVILSFLLAAALLCAGAFMLPLSASAAGAEAPAANSAEVKDHTLFLKANVPEDFNQIVCLTLKAKGTDKAFTLKVIGGTVFEVNIDLPAGEYEVVSAFVEDDDSYTVAFNETEITVGEGLSPSITLDVQQNAGIEPEPGPDVSPSASGSEVGEQSSEPEDDTKNEPVSDTPVSSEDPVESDSAPEISAEPEEESSSASIVKTLFNILISIAATVIFCVVLIVVILIVRRRLEGD